MFSMVTVLRAVLISFLRFIVNSTTQQPDRKPQKTRSSGIKESTNPNTFVPDRENPNRYIAME